MPLDEQIASPNHVFAKNYVFFEVCSVCLKRWWTFVRLWANL